MKIEHTVRDQDLVIIGLAQRTSLATAAQDIPAFWQRFLADEAQALRRAEGQAIYAVYTDYESDDRGPYTMVLGVAVEPQAPVPAGMRRVRLPHGRYARLVVAGDPREQIGPAWQHINGAWEGRRARRFIADYERHAAGLSGAEVAVGIE